jgi:hypothetical protein
MVRCRVSTGAYTRADTCGRRIGGQVKKTTKAPPTPTKVDTIILHIYALMGLGPGGSGFSPQDFIDWFKALDDPSNPVSDKMVSRGYQCRILHQHQIGSQRLRKIASKERSDRGVHRTFDARSAQPLSLSRANSSGRTSGGNPKRHPKNFIEQIRSVPRDHFLLRCENRRGNAKLRAARYRPKLRDRHDDPHPEDGQCGGHVLISPHWLGKGWARTAERSS